MKDFSKTGDFKLEYMFKEIYWSTGGNYKASYLYTYIMLKIVIINIEIGSNIFINVWLNIQMFKFLFANKSRITLVLLMCCCSNTGPSCLETTCLSNCTGQKVSISVS